MSRAGFLIGAGLLIATVLVGLLSPGGPHPFWLALAGGLLVLLTLLVAPPPWPRPRQVWRVRYEAAPGREPDPRQVGPALVTLARYARGAPVAVVWCRRAGDWALYLVLTPLPTADILPGLLHQVLGTVEVAVVDALPDPPVATRLWYGPLAGGPSPLATIVPALLGEGGAQFTGDLELRWQLTPMGGTGALAATPTNEMQRGPGLRPLPAPARLRRWLLRHDPLWDAWKEPPALVLPATATPAANGLSTHCHFTLPAPILPDVGEDGLVLGVATANGAPVRVPCSDLVGVGPWLVLGDERPGQRTAERLLAGVVAVGGSVVRVRGERWPGAPLPTGKSYQIDLDHPAASVHGTLLRAALPPVATVNRQEQVCLAAQVALTDHVALLVDALTAMGVLTHGAPLATDLARAWATLLACRAARQPPGHSDSPEPTLAHLWEQLAASAALPHQLAQEAALWRAREEQRGANSNGLGAVVGAALAALPADYGTGTAQQQAVLGLHERLGRLVRHPHLRAFWHPPATAWGAILHEGGVGLDVYLPDLAQSGREGVARLYGYWLLAGLLAVAAERRAVQQAGGCLSPLLVLLDGDPGWWLSSFFGSRLGQLAAAQMIVLTRLAALPDDFSGLQLLGAATTWWLHTLTPADARRIAPLLHRWGLTADLPLAQLPPGWALLKLEQPGSKPVITTVQPPAGGLSC